MKCETRRRLRDLIKILKRGEIGTAVWETGFYRILWWGENSPWPKKVVYGHLRLP